MSAFNLGQLFGVVILVLIVIGVARELMKRGGEHDRGRSGGEAVGGTPPPPPSPPPSPPPPHPRSTPPAGADGRDYDGPSESPS